MAWLASSTLACACGGSSASTAATRAPEDPPNVAPSAQAPAEPVPRPATPPPEPAPSLPEPTPTTSLALGARSCRSRRAATRVAFTRVLLTRSVGEHAVALAWREDGQGGARMVLLSLDGSGALVDTPLALPFQFAPVLVPAGETLVAMVLSERGLVVQRLQLAPSVVAEPAVTLGDVPRGWFESSASDGARLLFTYGVARPDSTIGEHVTVELSLAPIRVVRRAPTPPGEQARCADAACASIAIGAPSGEREQSSDDYSGLGATLPFADGLIDVRYAQSSGMMHSPTDENGVRRYFEQYTFEGGDVGLIAQDGARRDVVPLPVAHAEGQFSDGYGVAVLRHGLHAAVLLLAPGTSAEGSWMLPYRAPCPARQSP